MRYKKWAQKGWITKDPISDTVTMTFVYVGRNLPKYEEIDQGDNQRAFEKWRASVAKNGIQLECDIHEGFV